MQQPTNGQDRQNLGPVCLVCVQMALSENDLTLAPSLSSQPAGGVFGMVGQDEVCAGTLDAG